VVGLDLEEFDEAFELLQNVRKRHGQEDLIRQNVASQGDAKAVKKLAKDAYTRKGDRPLGTKSEKEFLYTFAKGL
jgi:hypothetical protein